MGVLPQKMGEGEKLAFSAQFRTTSHFDREYLRNGTRYRQSENFGPQMAKNRTVV